LKKRKEQIDAQKKREQEKQIEIQRMRDAAT